MTQFDFILILIAIITTTWAGIITAVAKIAVFEYKKQIKYYQQPEIQVKIAQNAVQQRFFKNGGEVFR